MITQDLTSSIIAVSYNMSGLKNPSLSRMCLGISLQFGAILVSIGLMREWPNLKAAVANSLKMPGLQVASYSFVYPSVATLRLYRFI